MFEYTVTARRVAEVIGGVLSGSLSLISDALLTVLIATYVPWESLKILWHAVETSCWPRCAQPLNAPHDRFGIDHATLQFEGGGAQCAALNLT